MRQSARGLIRPREKACSRAGWFGWEWDTGPRPSFGEGVGNAGNLPYEPGQEPLLPSTVPGYGTAGAGSILQRQGSEWQWVITM